MYVDSRNFTFVQAQDLTKKQLLPADCLSPCCSKQQGNHSQLHSSFTHISLINYNVCAFSGQSLHSTFSHPLYVHSHVLPVWSPINPCSPPETFLLFFSCYKNHALHYITQLLLQSYIATYYFRSVLSVSCCCCVAPSLARITSFEL